MTGLCKHPGCTNPGHIDGRKRQYKLCLEHIRASRKEATARRLQNKDRRPQELLGQTVCIIVVDYTDNLLLRLEGVVKTTEPMPTTYAELQKLLAQAAQQGHYVAQPHAWKQEDLHESA